MDLFEPVELKIVDEVEVRRSSTSLHMFVGTNEGPMAEAADRISDEIEVRWKTLQQDIKNATAASLAKPDVYCCC